MYVSVSNLHFPQMKVTSEKPPEANFPAGACPQIPLDYGMQSTLFLIPFWQFGQTSFFGFLQRRASAVW